MHKETVYQVKFMSPGAFVADTSMQDVASPDPRLVKWPDNAYAFTLTQREDVVDGDERYKGRHHRIGGLYYHPDSKVETAEQVGSNPAATRILIGNIRNWGWKHIVWSRWGNWPQGFDPALDVVLPK